MPASYLRRSVSPSVQRAVAAIEPAPSAFGPRDVAESLLDPRIDPARQWPSGGEPARSRSC
jgi:hypothetical protein